MFSYGLQVIFVVLGMHLAPNLALGGAEPGNNVVFTGPVSEEMKAALFALADVALAPMRSGTGSSLKIPEYIAYGKIVVGTLVGLRGFDALLKFPSVIASDDIAGALARVLEQLKDDPDAFTSSCREAREWVKSTLDWPVVARPILDGLKAAIQNGSNLIA